MGRDSDRHDIRRLVAEGRRKGHVEVMERLDDDLHRLDLSNE